jgi:hypothetical protein
LFESKNWSKQIAFLLSPAEDIACLESEQTGVPFLPGICYLTPTHWSGDGRMLLRSKRIDANSRFVLVVALLVLTLSLGAFARADEIEFATLPQPIQTTVIRETHIPSASAVTRVIRQDGGIYAVTVRQDEGTRVVYVNESGTIVQAPGSTVTTTTTEPTEQQVITYEEVQQDLPRYQLIKKDHDKEIYLDRQTGKKVKVERKD